MDFNKIFFDNLIVSRGRRRGAKASSLPPDWQDILLLRPKFRHSSGIDNPPLPPLADPADGGWRLLPFWLLVLITTAILIGRLYQLQIVDGRKNLTLSEINRVLSQVVKPERGAIFDRNGAILARNQPGFSIVLNLGAALTHPERSGESLAGDGIPVRRNDSSGDALGMTIHNLSKTLSVGEDEILKKVRKAQEEGKTLVTIKTGLDRDTALKIEANAKLFPGVSTVVEPVRDYIGGEVFAHLLGFVGEASREDLRRLAALGVSGGDKVGKSNLEFLYERFLRGREGERLIEVDAFGHRFRTLSEKKAVAGNSLVLTIDASLQKAVFDALLDGIKKSQASGGAAVVQDVQTGEIRALVSLPSFDPNLFAQGISETDYQRLLTDPHRPLFNRAISGAYPPGSTFKLVTAAAALEEGVITPEVVIDDRGSIAVGSFVFRGWASEGLGPVNLISAIAKSSDIYFYTVGGGYGDQRGVGVRKLAEWARRFGLGSPTGVDLTGEVSGLVPDEEWKLKTRGEPWYIGNTYHMSIGQGDLLVTPLQLNNLVSSIANGGTLFKPFLLKEVRDGSGNTIYRASPEILRSDIASPETLGLIREGMRAAASPGGTAYPLYDFKVAVAGKTGTSETGRGEKTHAWFTCFAPYEKPEIAVTVFLEEGGEGSHDAAPVVREILEHYFWDR